MDNNTLPFNSHYVPLNPPYPILYYHGRIGIQTGSLLVVQPSTRGGNVPGLLRMVSMPVVNYVNKSKQLPVAMTPPEHMAENVVWQTDISRTELLGYDNAEEIHIEDFSSLERLRNLSGMSSGFSLSRLVRDIEMMGFKISPNFYPKDPHGSLELMYGHLDSKNACLTSNYIKNLVGLFIAVREDTTDRLFSAITEQVDDYLGAVGNEDITIEFKCQEQKFAELIKNLNQYYSSHP